MTPAELKGALIDLGWTDKHLSRLLGCHHSLVQAWGLGRAEVPPPIADWLGGLVACHAERPLLDWRKHPGFGRSDSLTPRSKP